MPTKHTHVLATGTSDGSLPNPSPLPVITQTQSDDDVYPPSDGNPDLSQPMENELLGFDDIATQVNAQFDLKDDVLAAELEQIMDHRYVYIGF